MLYIGRETVPDEPQIRKKRGSPMSTMVSLSEVLEHIEELDWQLALFLNPEEEWTLLTPCAILDPDDVEDDEDEEPLYAQENGLTYALDVNRVKGIVRNARGQKSNCTADDLLQAFLFYYDHDAYLDFAKNN
jgi:hypothetical protein